MKEWHTCGVEAAALLAQRGGGCWAGSGLIRPQMHQALELQTLE